MLLSPSNFDHNNVFNNRNVISANLNPNNLNFGTQGLVVTNNLLLTAQNMFSFNLLLNNSSRSSDNTSSKLWFNAFPHLPLTNNVVGSRMGNGNGKLNSWFSLIRSGHVIFEVNNLSYGSFNYFSSQISARLGCKCLHISNFNSPYTSFYSYSNNKLQFSFSYFT